MKNLVEFINEKLKINSSIEIKDPKKRKSKGSNEFLDRGTYFKFKDWFYKELVYQGICDKQKAKELDNEDLFYLDSVDFVDGTTQKNIPKVKADGSILFHMAFDRLVKYFNLKEEE